MFDGISDFFEKVCPSQGSNVACSCEWPGGERILPSIRLLTQYVPDSIERSTYVLFSGVAMIALFAAWQPMGGTIWSVGSGVGQVAIYSLYVMGWLLVLYATFLINQFDLFGHRQVWLYFQSKRYTQLQFRIPSLYRYVRHLPHVGWIRVMWSTPTMTLAHLMFAAITTS